MLFGFIGSGNMAAALARGWGELVLCTDSGSGRAQALAGELGGEAVASNRELALSMQPNTPAEVGCGVFALAEPDAPVDGDLRAAVEERFSRIRTVVEIPERLMPVAGASSGVAPATAATLVTEGMAGTAELLVRRYDGDTLAVGS